MRFRNTSLVVGAILLHATLPAISQPPGKGSGTLTWAIRYDPKTFDPAKVDDQASETIRFLTGGVLLRVNRLTQQPEPALAESYSVAPDGRTITFRLRAALKFSDGSSLSSRDVAASIRRVLAPSTAAPVAEEFSVPQEVKVESPDALTVRVLLPKRVIAIAKVFDEIAIEPADHPSEERITSGPFLIEDYKRGQYILLKRNPNYWRRDSYGVQLPYLSGVRLDILNNREQEISRFQRGNYDFIDSLPAEYFALLSKRDASAVRDLGPSLNTEQLWFNEAQNSPLPSYEKAWFTNRSFRVAISQAIHRADLARIAYDGHATPAYSFISPANTPWYNRALKYPHEDVSAAAQMLAANGFHKTGNLLYDAANHQVKFSILTNAGQQRAPEDGGPHPAGSFCAWHPDHGCFARLSCAYRAPDAHAGLPGLPAWPLQR